MDGTREQMTEQQFDALVLALREEMVRSSQDPDVLDVRTEDQSVRLPLSGTEWYSVRLNTVKLDLFDAHAMARDIYATYRASQNKKRS